MTAEDGSQQSEGTSAVSTAVSSPTPLEEPCRRIAIRSKCKSPDGGTNVSINLGGSGSSDDGGGGGSAADNSLEVVIPKGRRIQICLEWSDSAEGFVRCSAKAEEGGEGCCSNAAAAASEGGRAGSRLSDEHGSLPVSPQSERTFATALGDMSAQGDSSSRGKADRAAAAAASASSEDDSNGDGEAPKKQCHTPSEESFKTGHSEDQNGPKCNGPTSNEDPPTLVGEDEDSKIAAADEGSGKEETDSNGEGPTPAQTPSHIQHRPSRANLEQRADQTNDGQLVRLHHTQLHQTLYQVQDPMYLTPPHGRASLGGQSLPLMPLLLTPNSVPSPPHIVRDADAAACGKFDVVGLVAPPPAPPSSWDEENDAFTPPPPANRCDTISECDNEDEVDPSSTQSSGLRERRCASKEDRGANDKQHEAEAPAAAAAVAAAEAPPCQPEPPQRDPNKVYFVMNKQPNKQTSYYISSGEDVDPAVIRKPPTQSGQDRPSPHQYQEQPRRDHQGYPTVEQLDLPGGSHVGRVIDYDDASDVSSITVGPHECGMYPGHAALPQGTYHTTHGVPYGIPPYGHHPNQVYPAYPQHYHLGHHPVDPNQYGPYQQPGGTQHPHAPYASQPIHSHPMDGHHTPGHQQREYKVATTHGVDLLGQIVDLITPQCCATTTRAIKSLGVLQPFQSVRSMKYHQGVRRRSLTASSKRRSARGTNGSSVSSTKVRVEIAEPAKATQCLQSMRGSYL